MASEKKKRTKKGQDVELNDINESSKDEKPRVTAEFKEDSYFGNVRITEDANYNNQKSEINDPDTLISMKNVHKTYLLGVEGVPALRGVSMTIKKGEFVCIFGTSGGGKTTMLNIIGTIDKPTKGELRLCGTRITQNTKDVELSLIRLQKIGFVFQTFNLLSSLSAIENVEMPMILNGVLSQSQRRSRAKELLELVGMGKRLDHLPSQLSGGEQQRVTIARAIANNPEILLLDEPTGDLDSLNTHIVMQLLTQLNQKQRITMVMVTHDVGLKNFADRIIWMRDGKIQRIENVPKEKKTEAIRKNDEEIETLKNRKKLTAHGTETQYRNPSDYVTFAYSKSHATNPSSNPSASVPSVTSNGNGNHASKSSSTTNGRPERSGSDATASTNSSDSGDYTFEEEEH